MATGAGVVRRAFRARRRRRRSACWCVRGRSWAHRGWRPALRCAGLVRCTTLVAIPLNRAARLALHAGESALCPGLGEPLAREYDDERRVAGVAGQQHAAYTTRKEPAGLSTDGLDELQGNLVHHADPGELGFAAVE